MTLLSAVLVVIALVPLPASMLLAAQMLASLKRRPDRLQSRTGTGTGAACPAFTVVVPAHDEATVIAATIRSLRAQLRPDDRLLVVADNCTDDTAAIARSEGAMVTERFDAERRGKGYALEWGVRHDLARATAVTIVVDADCLVSPGGWRRWHARRR
ncbi:glycosyltransferase family 2 protein [Sphingomonas sp. LR55]|uniref:glycosyltransferase family 2 protein n=1 Tax=Sphingomonas sp. LR55 TaxID=3050231 RepID=UPI002FE0F192